MTNEVEKILINNAAKAAKERGHFFSTPAEARKHKSEFGEWIVHCKPPEGGETRVYLNGGYEVTNIERVVELD